MSRTDILSKLLAKEDITVTRRGTHTASFDVLNRVLYLPLWDNISKDLEDLLIGHEVGHALFTPTEGWHESDVEFDFPRTFINVIEDIRIERLVMDKYPGLKRNFKLGYIELIERDFFGTQKRELVTYGFMDRLNIKAKGRDLVDVPFTDDELPYVKLAMGVETFDDVLDACQKIYDWLKEEKQENEQSSNANPEDYDTDSSNDIEYQDQDSGENAQDAGGDGTESETVKDKDDGDKGDEEASVNVKEPSPLAAAAHPDEVETDNAFRHNEDRLLDTNNRGNTYAVMEQLKDETVNDRIIPYKTAYGIRMSHIDKVIERSYDPSDLQFALDQANSEFSKFMEESRKTVNMMAKEFEMRKAAYRQTRAKVSKSGALDVSQLHNYKFTDDLFLRHMHLGDAKDHGIVSFIDFSGSMHTVIKQVVEQAIVLALFCRKVNIPFDIYSFTTPSARAMYETDITQDQTNTVDLKNINLIQQLTSSMRKAEFIEVARSLFVGYCTVRGAYVFASDMESLGSTPLNEALLMAHNILPKFKKKHNVQVVSLVNITDGAGNYLNYHKPIDHVGYSQEAKIAVKRNKFVKCSTSPQRTTKALLTSLKEEGYNTISFFITNSNAEARYVLRGAYNYDETKVSESMKQLKKNNTVAVGDKHGYDSFFVVDGRVDALDDEFEVKANAKKGDITRAFKKFANSKKGNRTLATSFAKAITL